MTLLQKAKNLLAFSVAYFILCNTASLLYRFSIYQSEGSFLPALELMKDSVYILIFLCILFVGLSINNIFFRITSLFLFVSGAIASYYLYLFKIQPSVRVLTAVFNVQSRDFIELINVKLFLWVSFVIVVWYFLTKKYIFYPQKLGGYIFAILCLLVSIHNFIDPYYRVLRTYFPSQYLNNFYIYTLDRLNQREQFDISTLDFRDNSASDLVVVLVIGESARYDRFGINGYHRNTTPKLQEISNLFNFQSIACDSITYTSVPCMLKRSTQNTSGKDLSETTLLSVFNKLGFQTSWIGSQSILKYSKSHSSLYNEVDFTMLPGGSVLYPMNAQDGDLLPFFENVLSASGRKLVVLHTSGSHWDYAARYPSEFEIFKKVCKGDSKKRDYASCALDEISNMYDNSIVYTDHILSEIISRLKHKNAILFYTSDHGESLGENGVYGHGGDNIKEQMEVPFFVWASDSFNNQNPELSHNLLKNNKKAINYKYLFHSILDCSNIKSDVIDHSLSLCK
jgi:glucan phosphoethanolaminetransferase (alkaline phosphatase superfamily)